MIQAKQKLLTLLKIGSKVIHQDKKEIEKSKFESVNLVISFGYRHLLSETIVKSILQ